ncbi:DUF1697 domain-containing protein [Egicoccus sp. AB-alg2]|uniref:DUF1697 domain-containing protein n=1 Tax=Egicoccus sp. AB-alg2 TaxID=3242693 RepID=UPI00359D8117
MPTYAAFLRGMNVGGHRITNAELAAAMAALGFAEVGTFLASGNLHFAAPHDDAGELEGLVEAHLQTLLGYAVPTFVRTREEVTAIAAAQPFPPEAVAATAGKVQVVFLRDEPSAAQRNRLLGLATDDDRLAIVGRELYWLPRGGISDAGIDLMQPSLYPGPATMRTKRTVERLATRL